eukprot:TRINITY_DN11751_c0_g1_i2.p1 TRINITY_DN11751_c0_g1~~TRINITY_DN11751_c0_g1_i2.p1  ORF type:complete len:599 (+),score=117.33 TRINITY_DN11751_c0_g1_i2:26-1822(+)
MDILNILRDPSQNTKFKNFIKMTKQDNIIHLYLLLIKIEKTEDPKTKLMASTSLIRKFLLTNSVYYVETTNDILKGIREKILRREFYIFDELNGFLVAIIERDILPTFRDMMRNDLIPEYSVDTSDHTSSEDIQMVKVKTKVWKKSVSPSRKRRSQEEIESGSLRLVKSSHNLAEGDIVADNPFLNDIKKKKNRAASRKLLISLEAIIQDDHSNMNDPIIQTLNDKLGSIHFGNYLSKIQSVEYLHAYRLLEYYKMIHDIPGRIYIADYLRNTFFDTDLISIKLENDTIEDIHSGRGDLFNFAFMEILLILTHHHNNYVLSPNYEMYELSLLPYGKPTFTEKTTLKIGKKIGNISQILPLDNYTFVGTEDGVLQVLKGKKKGNSCKKTLDRGPFLGLYLENSQIWAVREKSLMTFDQFTLENSVVLSNDSVFTAHAYHHQTFYLGDESGKLIICSCRLKRRKKVLEMENPIHIITVNSEYIWIIQNNSEGSVLKKIQLESFFVVSCFIFDFQFYSFQLFHDRLYGVCSDLKIKIWEYSLYEMNFDPDLELPINKPSSPYCIFSEDTYIIPDDTLLQLWDKVHSFNNILTTRTPISPLP